MRQRVRLLPAFALCVGMALPACTSMARQTSPEFFTVRHEDSAAVQALIREQERQVQACAAARACPRAHYFRGLAALYEDRAVAAVHFQAALAGEPDGPYGPSSRYWVQLLSDGQNESVRETVLGRAVERLVREVMEEEAAVRRAALRAVEPGSAAAKEAQAVQSLRRQLKEREKKIDELTRQIDALKRVDQEVKDQVKPSRPVN